MTYPPAGGPDYDVPKPKDPPAEARMPLPLPQHVDWPLVTALAQPFPDRYIRQAPAGKYGTYVNHADVTQRLISEVGFFDYEVTKIVYGQAPAIMGRNDSNQVFEKFPAREGAVVAVLARLTITDRNQRLHSITETGTVDNPAMHHDGESLKNATSDAFKRCAMRLGLGLHLWSVDRGKSTYWLAAQLEKDHGKDKT